MRSCVEKPSLLLKFPGALAPHDQRSSSIALCGARFVMQCPCLSLTKFRVCNVYTAYFAWLVSVLSGCSAFLRMVVLCKLVFWSCLLGAWAARVFSAHLLGFSSPDACVRANIVEPRTASISHKQIVALQVSSQTKWLRCRTIAAPRCSLAEHSSCSRCHAYRRSLCNFA